MRLILSSLLKLMFEKLQTHHRVSFGSDFFLSLLLLIAAFSYMMVFETTFVPDLYQARDIRYATGILNGEFVWFGPDLTGGGKIPGSFYYWLLALPIGIFGTWKATYYFCYFLASSGVTLLWFYMRQKFGELSAWFSYVLFLTSFSVILNLGSFWNPSYLYFFQVLVLLALDRKEFKNPRHLFAGAILLGLSLQIHLTQIIFLFASIIAISCSDEKKRRVQNLMILLLGVSITLFPYLYWRASESVQVDIFEQFLAGGSTFLRPLWFFISNPLEWTGTWFENLLGYLKQSIGLELSIVPGLIVFFFCRAQSNSPSLFLKSGLFASICLFFWVGFQSGLDRYLVPFYFLLIIFVSAQLGNVFSTKTSRAKVFLGICFFLSGVFKIFFLESLSLGIRSINWVYLGISFVCAVLIFFYNFKVRKKVYTSTFFLILVILILHLCLVNSQMKSQGPAKILPPTARELEEVASVILRKSGWNYDFLRENTFIYGIDPQSDFSTIYDSVQLQSPRLTPNENMGLIFFWKSERSQLDLLSLPLPSDFRILKCEEEFQAEKWYLCFYMRGQAAGRAIRRNNIGYSYRMKQPPLHSITAKNQITSVNPNEVTMSIHGCKNQESSCTVFFKMSLLQNSQMVFLTVLGDPLGTPDPAPNPAWSLQLRQFEMEVDCKGLKTTYPIASHLGFKSDRKTYLAPFDAQFKISCARPKSIIVRGRGESVFHNYFYERFEPFQLEWKPN